MKIDITRQSVESTTLFSATESEALALLRNHVRAIDDSEDDLLKIYLDAALDYMQSLTDRLLGTHDVTIYINKEESKRPVSAAGIQEVTSVGNLYYYGKDEDDAAPWSSTYKLIGEAAAGEGDAPFAIPGNGQSWLLPLIYEATGGSATVTRQNVCGLVGSGDVFAVTFSVEKMLPSGVYGLYTDITPITRTDDTTVTMPDNVSLPVGYYRVKAVTIFTDASIETSYAYFTVTDGKDFDNRIITERYPVYLDLHNGLDLIDDGSEYDEDFWKLNMTAGTALASLPKQYKQAALLLVGHYYNMREAENVGGISSELKEGVQRLMASARQY